MALNAHLEELKNQSNPEADQTEARGTTRRALFLEVSGRLPGGLESNVVIHNISVSGMLMETRQRLEQGERLVLDLPEAGMVRAVIVWQSGELFGCAFEQALDHKALSAVQLQSDPAVDPAFSAIVDPSIDVASPPLEAPPEPLGVKLHRLRRERGMTLAKVADSLGVSKPTVWAWEKGKARPLPDRLELIAQVLGVQTHELEERMSDQQHAALVQECRLRIATAYGTHTSNVRIMIEV